jgi:hypothetical protein
MDNNNVYYCYKNKFEILLINNEENSFKYFANSVYSLNYFANICFDIVITLLLETGHNFQVKMLNLHKSVIADVNMSLYIQSTFFKTKLQVLRFVGVFYKLSIKHVSSGLYNMFYGKCVSFVLYA